MPKFLSTFFQNPKTIGNFQKQSQVFHFQIELQVDTILKWT